jgi:L-fuculose-phosphate aldolase
MPRVAVYRRLRGWLRDARIKGMDGDALVRDAVLAAARGMHEMGLSAGTSGNVSARAGEGQVVITPSAVPYPEMTTEDLVLITLDGGGVSGRGGRRRRAPSSESPLHCACYRAFPEIGAVLHSHPPYASMFAAAHQPIPAVIDEAVLYAGGEVPVAAYAISGSAGVGDNAVAVLASSGSAVLPSHGLVTVAGTPAEALHQATVVEHCAHVAWGARILGGHIPLPPETLRTFGDAYRRNRSSGGGLS